MTVRWRLSLWYGLMSSLTLVALGFTGYSLSVRQQYLNIDRVLIASARLVESGIRATGRSYALEADTSGPAKDGIVMVLRAYTPDGQLVSRSPSDPGLPATDPHAPLDAPAVPAYYKVLPLPFGGVDDPRANTAFGTLSVNGQRWRRYVIEVTQRGAPLGYVEALTPLERLDSASGLLFRSLLLVTGLSVLAVFLVGWWLAGSLLRPVERMMDSARRITANRDLGQRIHTAERRDEFSRLAGTFNEMLASLQTAWDSQQRFVGDASHELRAPLTVLRGNAQLLRRHPHLDAGERDLMLADIEKDAARMARLVDDLLLLAQSDAGSTLRRSPVSLRATAAEAIRDARRLSAAHTVHLQAPEDAFMVAGEKDRLRQLLLILLDNALKYSPAGTAVTVGIHREGEQTVLTVADQGPGIPAEALPHIFERFYRVDQARTRTSGGAGLGLAIAQWIAGQLGGSLHVAQTGPDGTRFALNLQAMPGSTPPASS